MDDGSEDRTPQIIDDLSRHNNMIISLHKENGGVSSARNYGLDNAHGDYVIFVDSDDYLLPDFCEKMLYSLKVHTADVVCGRINGLTYSNEYTKKSEVLDSEDLRVKFDQLYKNWFFHNVVGKIYLMKYAQNCRFREELRVGEDLLFNFDYFHFVKRSVTMDYYGYQYLTNYQSAVHKYRTDDYFTQKILRDRSISFTKAELGMAVTPISINEVFYNNVADIIVVCITYEGLDTIRELANILLDDNMFQGVAEAKAVNGIKRKIITMLMQKNCIIVMYCLGRLNWWRHKLW